MSYYIYDENGYVGDFATTKGLDDFMKWCEGVEDIDVSGFAEEGMSVYPDALKESLELYDPPEGDIKKTYDNLLKLIPECQGVVIISDGSNSEVEEV
jgi:hypothetical protein